jgi:hypothetical protein
MTAIGADVVLTYSPSFRFIGSRYAQLTSPVRFRTPIRGDICVLPHVLLAEDGELSLSPGYEWDFGSGPAIDTPDMVYASLAHDALYDLMNAGELDRSWRKRVDQYFVSLLKRAGTPWIRRQWIYWGVRLGYPLFRVLGRKGDKRCQSHSRRV